MYSLLITVVMTYESLSDYWHVKPMTSVNYINKNVSVPFELSSAAQCPLYGHDPDFQIHNDLCKNTLQNVNVLVNVLSTECLQK